MTGFDRGKKSLRVLAAARIYELGLRFGSLCLILVCRKGAKKNPQNKEGWCLHSCCLNQSCFLADPGPPQLQGLGEGAAVAALIGSSLTS